MEKYWRISLHEIIVKGEKVVPGKLKMVLWEGYCSTIEEKVQVGNLLSKDYCILMEVFMDDSNIVEDSWFIYRSVKGNSILKETYNTMYESTLEKNPLEIGYHSLSVVLEDSTGCKDVIIAIDWFNSNVTKAVYQERDIEEGILRIFPKDGGEVLAFIQGNYDNAFLYFFLNGEFHRKSFSIYKKKSKGGKIRDGYFSYKSKKITFHIEECGNISILTPRDLSGCYSLEGFLLVLKDYEYYEGEYIDFEDRYVSLEDLKDLGLAKLSEKLSDIGLDSVFINKKKSWSNPSLSTDTKFVSCSSSWKTVLYKIYSVKLKRSFNGDPLYYTVNVLTNLSRGGINYLHEDGIYFKKEDAINRLRNIVEKDEKSGVFLEQMGLCINKERNYYLESVEDNEGYFILNLYTVDGCISNKSTYKRNYFKVSILKSKQTFSSDCNLNERYMDCLRCALKIPFVKRLLSSESYTYVVSVWDKSLSKQKVEKRGYSCISLKEAEKIVADGSLEINKNEVFIVDRFKESGTIDLSLVYNSKGILIKSIKERNANIKESS